MKNLVYMCLFLNENYLRFLELFFSSVLFFSKASLEDTDFLVITEEEFVKPIQAISQNLGIPIFIWPRGKPISIFISTVLRYEIFYWDKIQNYKKALYLDTDILVHGNLSRIFDMLVYTEKLYTFREGGGITHEFWGGDTIFDFDGEDKDVNKTTIGFCSGVILFEINPIIANIFEKVKEFMIKKIQVPGACIPICFDQPYINYVCVKYQLNENDSLEKVCYNKAKNFVEGIIIYHFPDVSFTHKYAAMIQMMLKMFDQVEHSTLREKAIQYCFKGEQFLINYNEYQDKYKKF
jgi:lipopolysaccharide biosynthesis glycosyltransferase